jgi:hypothetical protein
VRGDRLDRYYDLLGPLERFRLVVAAQARDDEPELDRLLRTCAREHYSLPDPVFGDRVEFSRVVVLVLIADLLPVLAKRELLETLTRPVGPKHSSLGFAALSIGQAIDAAAFAAVQVLRVDDEEQQDEVFERVAAAGEPAVKRFLDRLDELEQKLQRDAASQVQGFARFCRDELELDPLLLCRAFAAPLADEVEPLLELEADDEAARAYAETLTTIWRRRLGLPDRTPPADGDGDGA